MLLSCVAMGRSVALATALTAMLVALAACKDKKAEGLPPAQEWSANTNTLPSAPNAQGASPHAGMGANPHEGMGGGANPHAGMDMGGGPDPHAGMGGQNPHGGGGSPNVAAMGLPPPDPNRKIDPDHRVTGTIKVHAKAKDRVKAGGAVFVIVKQAGPDGAPAGPPLAVDKLMWQGDSLKFSMTDAQSMIAGTVLAGDVVVTARFDQDSDALSKQPGDVVGTVRAKVPADNVTLTLDDVLQ
jgi:hypothetical protein